ncbi:MAG: GDP-L-fucose synthase [Pseudomonadota bacterium]
MTRRIFLAGHRGMVGRAIGRRLRVLEPDVTVLRRTRTELDLREQADVRAFFKDKRPDVVILAAARVGGIQANATNPAQFIYDNLAVQTTVIHSAYEVGVSQLLFLGSSCVYPKLAEQPIRENALLTGPLEGTNEPYAIAKIAGLKMCEYYNAEYGTDFRCVMPSNLYGPYDNFDLETSHVLPALLRKFHEAKLRGSPEVQIWGSGTPQREFTHVDDMADASLHVMNLASSVYRDVTTQNGACHVNVGTGEEVSIMELAKLIASAVGYEGNLSFDRSRPDGTPRKVMDVSILKSLGWRPEFSLEDGIKDTYCWFEKFSHQMNLELMPDFSVRQ